MAKALHPGGGGSPLASISQLEPERKAVSSVAGFLPVLCLCGGTSLGVNLLSAHCYSLLIGCKQSYDMRTFGDIWMPARLPVRADM